MAASYDIPDLFETAPHYSKQQFDEIIKKADEKYNKYKFNKCVARNIVLIGRSRSGKSTIAHVIEDFKYVPPLRKFYAETREIEFHKIASTLIQSNTVFHFNVIDTPGFYETARSSETKLSNEQIQDYINRCIKNDVTQIHVFAFVFSLKDGINIQDIETMIFVKTHYPQIGPYMALVITHCEEASEERRQQNIDDFFEAADVKKHNLKEFFGLQIYFMGCLRPETKEARNIQAARTELTYVAKMREKFIDFCISRGDDQIYNINYDSNNAQRSGCTIS